MEMFWGVLCSTENSSLVSETVLFEPWALQYSGVDFGVARERRTTDLRAPRVFLTNVKLVEMSKSSGDVSNVAEAVPLSFMKKNQLFPLC